MEELEKLYCKNCGAEVSPYTGFCPKCGTTIRNPNKDAMRKAAKGKSSNKTASNRPSSSSTSLEKAPIEKSHTENEVSYAQPSPKPTKKSRHHNSKKPIYKRWWFWLLIIIVTITIIFRVLGMVFANVFKFKINEFASQAGAVISEKFENADFGDITVPNKDQPTLPDITSTTVDITATNTTSDKFSDTTNNNSDTVNTTEKKITLILDTASKCYHIDENCVEVKKIKPENKLTCKISIEEAKARGYHACDKCCKDK